MRSALALSRTRALTDVHSIMTFPVKFERHELTTRVNKMADVPREEVAHI